MDEAEISILSTDLSAPEHREAVKQSLRGLVGEPVGTGRRYSKDHLENVVRGLESAPNRLVLLVQEEDSFPGMCVGFYSFNVFRAAPSLHIHCLVVDPEYRREGVGRALIEQALGEAKRRSCCEVTLVVSERNKKAQHLFSDLGFEPAVVGDPEGELMFRIRRLDEK